MRRRARLALIAGLLVAGGLGGRAAPLPVAAPLSAFEWRSTTRGFGGFSGLEVAPGGASFVMVGDRARYVTGRFVRNAQGRITGIRAAALRPLHGQRGTVLDGYMSDAEDVAAAPDGSFYVSFEGWSRVSRYSTLDAPAVHLPRAAAFLALPNNMGLESVAVSADGTVYAVTESPLKGAFPVYRFRGTDWDQPFVIPRRGGFVPVSATFGPDGRFYLLERAFRLPFGFASRLRRFGWGPQGPADETVMVETAVGAHGNLEGVSVWRGPQGLVATLVSDDNFLSVLRTEILEYRLPD